MLLSDQIVVALIGVISALTVVLVKDIAFKMHEDRLSGQRVLLKSRIENAYAPVEFSLYQLLRIEDEEKKEVHRECIRSVLCHHSYFLSEDTISALYVLLDDENTGAALLQPHFFNEFAALKEEYYRLWYTTRVSASSRKSGATRAVISI